MTLCPNDEKPVIIWQYEGEKPNRIVGVDDYAIEPQKGQCEGVTYALTADIELTNPDGTTSTTRSGGFFVGKITAVGIRIPTTGTDLRPRFYVTHNAPSDPITRIVSVYSSTLKRATVTSYITDRRDGLPDDCGGCIFTAYKNGQVVYQKTNPECPAVTVDCIGSKCPPNTCSIPCGNHLCCVNANGIVASTIYK